jgi:preprotein translocase subunit SecY
MIRIFHYLKEVWRSTSLRKKLLFTLLMLLIYRLLVVIPVPFANIDLIMQRLNAPDL